MLIRLSDTDRRAFREGFAHFSPSLMAMFSWGLVTGIAMSKSVLTIPQALGMSVLVYAGSSQLAILPLLAAKLPIWTVLLTAAMVNTRFMIFSAGLVPHFSYHSFWRRVLIGFFNGDIIYLFFMRRDFPPGYQPGKEAYFWGMAVTSWFGWQLSSILGILLGSLFPDNWGLELAGTLALIPIMISAIKGRSTVIAVLVAGAVALLGFDLPYRLGLPVAVLAALMAGLASDAWIEHVDFRNIVRQRRLPAEPDNVSNSAPPVAPPVARQPAAMPGDATQSGRRERGQE